MKLRLPSLLSTALLACLSSFSTAQAVTFMAEGVNVDDLTASERFYDGGKGRDWDRFETAAYSIYTANGNDLSVFGDLAASITVPSYGARLDCSNLYNDSGHCWAYTSSNMLQYWQTYYGVFARKAGEDKTAPVHGLSYDKQYVSQLGGTQSLKLNKLFYDSFEGTAGGSTNKAFGWYLYGENEWGGQVDFYNGAPGYFRQYFSDYNDTHTTVNGQNLSSLGAMSESIKQAFGYTQQDGQWVQTTKGQIMHLELKSDTGSHAITCYGFETDEEGNIRALYVVNSDDAKHELIKVYTKFVEFGKMDYRLELHYDEECSGYNTYNAWSVTGWSNLNTPEALRNMLAEYEKGTLTWMGTLDAWTNSPAVAADVNTLPTDETGWMIYAGTGSSHAGYYNSYYSAGRGVEFNDAASSGTVHVAEDIAVPSMAVNNSSLAYSFTGTGQTITVESFTKEGTGAVSFSGVDVVAGTAVLEGDVSFDHLHVTGELSAEGKTIKANSITLDGDATAGYIGAGLTVPEGVTDIRGVNTTALTITGGTTKIENNSSWTDLQSLTLSDHATLDVGASLVVSDRIATTGDLSKGGSAHIKTKYCLYVGHSGVNGSGDVELAGSISAGAYINILGNAHVTGDVITSGDGGNKNITIAGNATIGGKLAAEHAASISGDAEIGGNLSSGYATSIGGDARLGDDATIGGNFSVGGKLTGTRESGKVLVTASGDMQLGGHVSNVELRAQSIAMAAADGSEVTLEAASMVLTGGELTLTNAVVRGDCSFSTTSDTPLTLNAYGVTFMLDKSNSSIVHPLAFFSTDPLLETQVANNPLYLTSSMLDGINLNGSLTFDLSAWEQELSTGNYDSVVLNFADAVAMPETISVKMGNNLYTNITPDELNSASFTIPCTPSGDAVPEPTTATLSLLALAALAARRRRQAA